MIALPARHLVALAESFSDTPDFAKQTRVLLLRQALEGAVSDYWQILCPGAERSPRGIQMLCLQAFMPDEQLAAEVRAAWVTLSMFCHHHPYDSPPSDQRLDLVMGVVRRFVDHAEEAQRAA